MNLNKLIRFLKHTIYVSRHNRTTYVRYFMLCCVLPLAVIHQHSKETTLETQEKSLNLSNFQKIYPERVNPAPDNATVAHPLASGGSNA